MKNYYSILGIKETASIKDIKKAYRMLSLKFHPDTNNGDSFFTEKFKEIQEAYEILRDASKRSKYDFGRLSNFHSRQLNPTIEYFYSSKSELEIDEEVTFSWKTNGANRIILNPFGEVTASGSKTVKLKYWENEIIIIELLIENTFNSKKDKSTFTLYNRSYERQHFKRIINKETKTKGDVNFFSDIVKFVLILFSILKLYSWLAP